MLWLNTLIAVIIVSLISFAGALSFVLKAKKMDHFLLYFVSFSVGALLGDVFLHIIPELAGEEGFTVKTGLYFLFGVLVFFAIEKFVHWHHCHSVEHNGHLKPLAYTNLIGDGLHNFLDGAVIAGSFLVSFPLGIATTLAVIFHEIPQEISDFGVLLYSGLNKNKALLLNFASACLAILGAIITLMVAERATDVIPFLLAIAGGGFVYIAGADLIPELHKECVWCKSLYQFLMMILGIGVMAALLFV